MDATTVTFEITKENFKSTINRNGVLLIDWWAPWCGPCRMFGPTYERVAARNPDVMFGKINTQEQEELAAANGILSIPTLMVLRDGILLFSEAGALPEAALEDLLKQIRAVDMAHVRAEIEAENGKRATN
jgi:thioredoxin 1